MKTAIGYLKLKPSLGVGVMPAQVDLPLASQHFGFSTIRVAAVPKSKFVPGIVRLILLFSLFNSYPAV